MRKYASSARFHRLLLVRRVQAKELPPPGVLDFDVVVGSIIRLPVTRGLAEKDAVAATAPRPPNIVVILTDDQGYADISFNPHHPKEVSTPHLDALARESVWFSQAYITGNVCSPTRAGLLTGRYQQRAGVYTAGEGGRGIAQTETIFPKFLKPAGYVSGAFGKWHLGLTVEQSPVGRGFDEWYGFLGRGAHDYLKLDDIEGSPIYRNGQPIKDEGYLTTRLTEETVAFIQKHKGGPFYVHLAYNAVHSPAQAPAAGHRPLQETVSRTHRGPRHPHGDAASPRPRRRPRGRHPEAGRHLGKHPARSSSPTTAAPRR
jgi:arylsulfatase A-like enzyme